MSPIDVVLIVGLWAWALWGSSMRTPMTVALLIAATFAYGLATQIGVPLSLPARVVVLTSTAWLLLLHTEWFIGMSRRTREFDKAYESLLDEVAGTAARRSRGEMEAAEFMEVLDDIAAQMDALSPPDQSWAQLQTETVRHMRSQVIRYGSAHEHDRMDLALDASDEESASIKGLHARLHSWQHTWRPRRGGKSTAG